MATVVNKEKKESVSITEQIKIIEYVKKLIEESNLFSGITININDISTTSDNCCLQLTSDAYKTSSFVDGSYEAEITFLFVYRRMNISNSAERLGVLDLVNQLGDYLNNIEEFDVEDSSYYIDSISQSTIASILYRDDSGIEDNGANFKVKYSKD